MRPRRDIRPHSSRPWHNSKTELGNIQISREAHVSPLLKFWRVYSSKRYKYFTSRWNVNFGRPFKGNRLGTFPGLENTLFQLLKLGELPIHNMDSLIGGLIMNLYLKVVSIPRVIAKNYAMYKWFCIFEINLYKWLIL